MAIGTAPPLSSRSYPRDASLSATLTLVPPKAPAPHPRARELSLPGGIPQSLDLPEPLDLLGQLVETCQHSAEIGKSISLKGDSLADIQSPVV